VGEIGGLQEGDTVDSSEGSMFGFRDGITGFKVWIFDGRAVEDEFDGSDIGDSVGTVWFSSVFGDSLGKGVGSQLGDAVGDSDGLEIKEAVGCIVGVGVIGERENLYEGCIVGSCMLDSKLGDTDGEKVGFNVELFAGIGDELGCTDVGKSIGMSVGVCSILGDTLG